MPAGFASVNLLGQEDFTHSPMGKIVTWATTYGRYIMVGTELIVLLAFISRFSLDRKLTDLKETIAQKQSIIQTNLSFENEIRSIQAATTSVDALFTGQSAGLDAITTIQGFLPADVAIDNIEVTKDMIKGSFTSGTVESFSLFLARLKTSKTLHDVALNGTIKRDPITGIEFQVEMNLAAPKEVAVTAAPTETSTGNDTSATSTPGE